jgi:hypothetical protein
MCGTPLTKITAPSTLSLQEHFHNEFSVRRIPISSAKILAYNSLTCTTGNSYLFNDFTSSQSSVKFTLNHASKLPIHH